MNVNNQNAATANANASASANASAGYVGPFWGPHVMHCWSHPPFVIFLAAIVCLFTFVMIIVAAATPYWKIGEYTVSGTPPLIGKIRFGLFSACMENPAGGRVCHDRTDFKALCDTYGANGSCNTWISRTWTIISTLIVATAGNLVALTVALMCICCVMPIHQNGTRLTVVVLWLFAFMAWLCYAIALGVADSLDYSVFDPVRAHMLQELGINTAVTPVYFEKYTHSHSHSLTGASLAMELVLFILASLTLYAHRQDTHVTRGLRLGVQGRCGCCTPVPSHSSYQQPHTVVSSTVVSSI